MATVADIQTTGTQVDSASAIERGFRNPRPPVEIEVREPSSLVQGLPLVLSIAVTLALALAFIAGQWLSTGGSVGVA